jgi:hypothetical protein
VLESYRLLRARMDSDDRFNDEDIPQLVICGHGSVDDPDGTVIYELTHETMATEPFQQIASDIVVARIPPSDQLLHFSSAIVKGLKSRSQKLLLKVFLSSRILLAESHFKSLIMSLDTLFPLAMSKVSLINYSVCSKIPMRERTWAKTL